MYYCLIDLFSVVVLLLLKIALVKGKSVQSQCDSSLHSSCLSRPIDSNSCDECAEGYRRVIILTSTMSSTTNSPTITSVSLPATAFDLLFVGNQYTGDLATMPTVLTTSTVPRTTPAKTLPTSIVTTNSLPVYGCVQCTDNHCSNCSTDQSNCSKCYQGFDLDSQGLCTVSTTGHAPLWALVTFPLLGGILLISVVAFLIRRQLKRPKSSQLGQQLSTFPSPLSPPSTLDLARSEAGENHLMEIPSDMQVSNPEASNGSINIKRIGPTLPKKLKTGKKYQDHESKLYQNVNSPGQTLSPGPGVESTASISPRSLYVNVESPGTEEPLRALKVDERSSVASSDIYVNEEKLSRQDYEYAKSLPVDLNHAVSNGREKEVTKKKEGQPDYVNKEVIENFRRHNQNGNRRVYVNQSVIEKFHREQ